MFTNRNEVLKMNKEDVINYIKNMTMEDRLILKNYLKERMGEDKNDRRKFMLTRAWIGNREFGPAKKKISSSPNFSDLFDALFEEEIN